MSFHHDDLIWAEGDRHEALETHQKGLMQHRFPSILKDTRVERYYRRIPEFGDRVLRVAVNTALAPWRVVSIFFDRNAKETS